MKYAMMLLGNFEIFSTNKKFYRQYNKQQHDEEDRLLIQIQEKLFADGDLAGNGSTDRGFRFRLREDLEDIDWSKFVGTEFAPQEMDNDDIEADLEIKKRQAEIMRWKMDMEKEQVVFEGYVLRKKFEDR